ncbi:hypothetical protein F5141DRAFT_1114201 [Pisolithus sp. B1]|nr:hypothetical protein F5141DRAFT_1114201 [Pisolithus sp. B1]
MASKDTLATSSSMQVAYLSLPLETWWECLSYVSKRDLQRLRLVCRFFARICFKPLFETLSWSVPNADLLLWGPPIALEDEVRGLYSFITDGSAADIHHTVRRLDFKGIDRGFRTCLRSPRISAAYSSYLALFRQALAAFTALRALNLTAVTIDDKVAASLQSLSFLSTLELNDCEVISTLPIQLPLCNFEVVSTWDCEDHKVTRGALHLVAPQRLEGVVIADDRWTSALFSAWGNVPMSFLTRLTIRVQRGQSVSFLNFLRQCPQLDSLFLAPDSSLDYPDGTLSPTTVPHLRVYEGPLILAHAFIIDRNITSARLDAVSVDDRSGSFIPMQTESIIGVLEMTLPAAPHVRTLRLCEVCPNLPLLRLVAMHMRELRTLELRLTSDVGSTGLQPEEMSESISQSAVSISASDLEGVLCVADHVGIPVDRSTGFPTEKYPPVETVLVWATLGLVVLPSFLEELDVQLSDYFPPMKGGLITSISPSVGACNGGLDVSRMLHNLSRRFTRLRRCTLNEQVWAFTAGDEGGAMDWVETRRVLHAEGD